MAGRASPEYNRVAGTNAIGGDTQEDGVTSLPRVITFSAGAGSNRAGNPGPTDLDLAL
jgi:hypothetical protein